MATPLLQSPNGLRSMSSLRTNSDGELGFTFPISFYGVFQYFDSVSSKWAYLFMQFVTSKQWLFLRHTLWITNIQSFNELFTLGDLFWWLICFLVSERFSGKLTLIQSPLQVTLLHRYFLNTPLVRFIGQAPVIATMNGENGLLSAQLQVYICLCLFFFYDFEGYDVDQEKARMIHSPQQNVVRTIKKSNMRLCLLFFYGYSRDWKQMANWIATSTGCGRDCCAWMMGYCVWFLNLNESMISEQNFDKNVISSANLLF